MPLDLPPLLRLFPRPRIRDIKLGKHVTGREDHLAHVLWVPRREDQPPIVRVRLEGLDDARELVDALAGVVGFGVNVLCAKVAPLEAVHGAEVALFAVGEA